MYNIVYYNNLVGIPIYFIIVAIFFDVNISKVM